MSDVTDHDLAQTGNERTGLYFAMLLMVVKLGTASAVGLTYPLLDWTGFKPGGENAPQALAIFRLIFAAIPVAAYTAIILIMLRFPLDEKKQQALRDKIAEQSV